MNLHETSDGERANEAVRVSAVRLTSPAILDDLGRIHLQLHLMEFRSREGLYSGTVQADRISELADEVQSVLVRLT